MSDRVDGHLATALEELVDDDGTPVLVALDFDGVLAPLVDDPKASRMTPAARAAVDRLGAHVWGGGAGRARLAFVSGRDLDDLAGRAAPPVGSYLVGSHGAQTGHATVAGLESVPLELTPEQTAVLAELTAALDSAVVGREGAWVQRKPSAAVLHTRQAGPADSAAAIEAAAAAAARLGLDAMHGKDVVEIAVLHTSKGEALERLRTVVAHDLGAPAARVLYAGDDTTDEKAFAVLGAGDVALKVGPGETLAAHRVPDPDGVAAVLDRITELLASGAGS
ncbi:trehalose-phosphatase [Isoptericola croceus]|uniref:trehalose-phosphatase n=1 Tax=Isoptericola croceus TaxID=3031406 RepID=UPI0023F83FA8|nr:trehalose-phosphatase [Isoptericola croceus]